MPAKIEPKASDEIEITPAMIEAGIREYRAADEILESYEEIVTQIFSAMSAAKKEVLASDC